MVSAPLSAQSAPPDPLPATGQPALGAPAAAPRALPADEDPYRHPVASPHRAPLEEGPPQGIYVAGTMLSPVLAIYLIPMTLLVVILAGLIVYTSRRKQLLLTTGGMASSPAPRRIHLPIAPPQEPIAASPAEPAPAGGASSAVEVPAAEIQTLFSTGTATRKKECPQCKRTYETIFELCPYDATKLRAVSPSSGQARAKRKPLGRLKCSSCERRYELGARYCYADGLPLVPDTDEEAATAPRITVCQACGFEGGEKDRLCPRDNEPLTVIEPNDNSRVAPTIPLLLCKTCRRYASPGTVHCPHDGELLSPVLNARIMALSPTGFGVRRKLCRKCGTRFSGAATFCSHDGTKLTPIN